MIGTVVNRRYQITTEIGRGGMGVVYRARDTLLGRDVAVKVLSDSTLGTEGRARLLREARAAAQLNHPNIVNVYDASESESPPFIVMELVDGPTLRALPPQSLSDALGYVAQICAALAHAHEHGIIHRDLKLENAVLTPGGVVKLMDFGLARSAAARLTQEGTLVGTVAYLAPELIAGGEPSPQSDLYALGVMFYELLTGRPPFEGADPILLLGQHLHAPITPPSQHNPAIPPQVDALVARLLSKQPADRPASAHKVVQALTVHGAQAPSPKSAPHNLPAHLSNFIGREKELALIKRRLEAHRLVTLTGSGGVGKTRLAIQAAHQVLPEYPDGVWLVELAALTDPALVPQTVATTLDICNEEGQPILRVLIDYLRQKTALLILDNCEHVIDASAQLTEQLLAHCPNVRLCATSREALGIEGEIAVRVPSLTLPPADQTAPEKLADCEAVRLFMDRAAAALPDFALNESNALIIAQVCRRLDGIALAIELAASRVRVLRVEQIAARLDDTFRLLTGGSRTALPRQQTLRATIDWSYDLLADAERALFRRLSVFIGGWTLEAAEAICALEPEPGEGRAAAFVSAEVLDLLTHLVEKSLVVVRREQGAEARYDLLETIRQYAREKLLQSGEGQALRGQHLDHFLQLAEQAEIELHRHDQKRWLARLETEHDNLRAALEWAIEARPEAALRLGAGLAEFWDIRGYLNEGREWATRVLEAAQDLPAAPACVNVLYLAAGIAARQADVEQFQALLEKGLELARQIKDRRGIAKGLHGFGLIMEYFKGKPEEADTFYADSLRLWRELGDKLGIGQALGPQAARALRQQNYAEAERFFNESLALFRELGDQREIAGALWNLAQVALTQANNARAQALASESLALYRELEDKHGVATALRTFGQATSPQAGTAQLEALYEESCRLFRELSDRGCLALTLATGGRAMLAAGDIHQAQRMIWEALALAKEVGEQRAVASTLEGAAQVLFGTARWQDSTRLFGAAESYRESTQAFLTEQEQGEHDAGIMALRAQLDEETFAQAWAEGKRMTVEQAIEYASSKA